MSGINSIENDYLQPTMSGTVDQLPQSAPTAAVFGHDEEAESEEEDPTELFSAVLASIRLDQLPGFASAVRQRTHPSNESGSSDWIGPVAVGSPLLGSYHVLFPLDFSDGVRWLLKVPANGTRDHFDEPAAKALSSEALTMRLLRRETTIPVPEVFAFDATLDNELKCPFILMRFIPGMSLYNCWFDKGISKDSIQARRTRTLAEIAAAMVQLDKFSFDQGGSIVFDDQGHPASIGPTRHVDNQAMLERLKTDDPDETALYVELGPHVDPNSFYTSVLDRQPEPDSLSGKGELMLIRLFLDWIPRSKDGRKEFVLTHPDFDIQNIIVSEDGGLQGLIDWDGVAVVPRSLGNERYPGWLTRDWDPAMYGYREAMDEGIEPAGLWEDSPETLAFYRATYRIMESCLSQEGASRVCGQDACNSGESGLKSSLSWTRNTLITENLYIAAENPMCTGAILDKIFDEIAKVVGKGPYMWSSSRASKSTDGEVEGAKVRSDDDQVLDEKSERGDTGHANNKYEPDDFHIYDVACALADGNLDQRRMSYLETGFNALLSGDMERQRAKP